MEFFNLSFYSQSFNFRNKNPASNYPAGLSFLLTCSAKWNHSLSTLQPFWRRRRDSNPRYPFEVYTLSRRAPSTARTLLLYLIPSETTRPQTISSERRGNVQIFSEFFPFSLRKIEFSTFIRSNGRLLLNPDSKNPIGISSRPFCYHFRLHTV